MKKNNPIFLKIRSGDFDGVLTTPLLIRRIVHFQHMYGQLPVAIGLDQENYTQLIYITEQDFVLGQHPKFRGLDVMLLQD